MVITRVFTDHALSRLKPQLSKMELSDILLHKQRVEKDETKNFLEKYVKFRTLQLLDKQIELKQTHKTTS